MNATLFDGGKVHRLTGRAARCGVGKSRRRSQWQTELCDVTCLRCAKVIAVETQSNLDKKLKDGDRRSAGSTLND